MRILIADDSSDKIGAINNALRGIPEYEMFAIDMALDLSEAKKALYENFYDVLILDLNMPIQIGETANMQAGIDFVNEVMSTDRIKKPIDIVVLSAFDESVQAFKKDVENEGFVTIQYSQTVETWKNVLISRIKYLNLLCEQRRFVPMPPKCDVLLITAVDVESEAIRGWSNHWKKFMPEDDSTVYEYI